MKKFKKYLESLNYNYSTEIIILISINVLPLLISIAIYLFLYKKYYVFLIAFFLSLLLDYLTYLKYSNKKQRQLMDRDNELITLLTYFESYIANGFNVYSSLKNISVYASTYIKENIEGLLDDIDKDKSVEPFIKFSKKFHHPLIEQVLISIYQMIDEGEDIERLRQFDLLFNKLNEISQSDILARKVRKLENLGVYPLINAGLITLFLTFGILLIVGDMINVL